MKENDPQIVVIIGAGRSGSTLIDLLLEDEDIFSVGELRYFFSRSFQNKQLCGCGEDIFNCELWSKVVAEIENNTSAKDYLDGSKGFDQYERLRFFYRHIFKTFSEEEKMSYARINELLLASISRASGKRIIVDSSKFPIRALALLNNKYFTNKVKVIHLVRDPRAVAYSWSRKKIRPEFKDKKVYMDRPSNFYSIMLWNAINWMCEYIKSKVDSNDKVTIRYESFCKNPVDTLSEIKSFIKERDYSQKTLEPYHSNHSLSGNPIRFDKSKKIVVRRDDEWSTSMPRLKQILLGIPSKILLTKYKYKL